MKKCLKSVLFLLLSTMFACALPVCAKAAVFQSVPRSEKQAMDEGDKYLEKLKIGNKQFWIRDDKLCLIASKNGKSQKIASKVYGAVTDGKTIYFTEQSGGARLYSYTVASKKKSLIGTVEFASVIGRVGNKIYMYGLLENKYGINVPTVAVYDLKTKKTTKKVVDYQLDKGSGYDRYVTGCGKYQDGLGDGRESLYLYDLVSGKGKLIAKKGAGYKHCLVKNKLYYRQNYYKNNIYQGTKIYAYDLKKGKKSAVTKMFKGSRIKRIASDRVTYLQEDTLKAKTIKYKSMTK